MRDEIYWIVTCSVRPGKFEEFKGVVKPLVAATRAEQGSIAYDYSVTEDESTVQIYEMYRDSAAVVRHVTEVFSQFADDFDACVSLDSFVVYGWPDDSARKILDGFGSVYLTPFEGFISKD
jgi:quinol monooxygenase YgiN